MYGKIRTIHFVGIGGIGMSGIAEVLLNLGYQVSGSDLRESDITRRLEELGGRIRYGHQKENIEDVDVVVTSTAGTHGKTTTTSMVATVLSHGGIDPTAVIGGRLDSLGSNAKLGQGKFLVAEADESDGSFMHLSPTIAVVTNIDADHLDYYEDLDEIKATFVDFINKIPFYGLAVLCLDDTNIQEVIPQVKKRFITYGLSSQADFRASAIEHHEGATSFTVHFREEELGRLSFGMPGRHNVLNCLATVAVAMELGLSFETIAEGISGFGGLQRRFQIRHDAGGIMVVDDYGHHPAEIKATLAAAKSGWNRRVVAVFQPHRYSRTKFLFDEFVTSFYQADHVIVTDVYAAGEAPIEGANAEALARGVVEHGHKNAHYIADRDVIVAHLMALVKEGDIVITLGAGDVWKVGEAFARLLREQD